MLDSEPVYFLIAGEASGDLLGARLMHALKVKTQGKVRFKGVGGPRMVAEGIELFFPQAELAHFGLFELLQHIPHILKRIRQTIAEIRRVRPTALITIDAPDFCFRVAKKLKGQGIPLIHYVAPTVWVWRKKRAKKVAQFLDHLLALLPFEPPYFTKEGLGCTFVGHPIVEGHAGEGDGVRFRANHKIASDTLLLTVLPGSRMSELSKLLPIYKETVDLLKKNHPTLHLVIPTIPSLVRYLTVHTASWSAPVTVVSGDDEKYDAFAGSRAALACSGTVAIELAMASLPAVTTYRVSPLTAALYGPFVRGNFANLVNVMHKRLVVPELLQEACTPQRLVAALEDLITSETARTEQINGLNDVASWFGRGHFIPSVRAAETVLSVVNSKQGQRTP